MSNLIRDPKDYLFADRKIDNDLNLTKLSEPIKKDINILVYETDPDIQCLYQQYMNVISPHVSCTIVDNIEKLTCSEDNSEIGKFNFVQESNFDTIIIDVKAGDYNAIKVVKELLTNIPRQKIVFTTTADTHTIKDEMIRQGLPGNVPILRKPFKFSQLLAVISPNKGKFDKLKLTDHVMASYNSLRDELMDAIDFFKKGIQSDELNLFLIRNDMDIKKTILMLKSKGLPNIDALLNEQSMILLKNKDWYIPDGKVDLPRIMNQWQHLVNQSIELNKKGLRAFCMMDCFFEQSLSKELVNYECSLPSQFQIPFIPICAYQQVDLDCLEEKDKKKLVECHNHMIICE